MRKLILLALLLLGASALAQVNQPQRRSVNGRTIITAADCSNTAVHQAINGTPGAQNGDVVQIPAGACTWSTPITFNGSTTPTVQIVGKAITIVGAGSGTDPATNTIITDQTGTAFISGLFWVTNLGPSITTTASFDLSGIRIIFNGTAAAGGPGTASRSGAIITVNGTVGALRAFRLHHMNFVTTVVSRGIVVNNVYGLIDHINYDATGVPSSASNTFMHATIAGADASGGASWKMPLALGTEQAVYIEDNTLSQVNNNNGIIDGYQGARYVIRHNTLNNATAGFHGTDSGPYRSVFSWEVYDNTYVYNPNPVTATPMFDDRGGTGVVYHNKYYNGTAAFQGVKISTYRSCPGSQWPSPQPLLGTCSQTTSQQCGLSSDCPPTETCKGWCSTHSTVACTLQTDCTGPPNNFTGDACNTAGTTISQWGSQKGACSISGGFCSSNIRCPTGETCVGPAAVAGGAEATNPLPQRWCDGTHWENPANGFSLTPNRQVCLDGTPTCVDNVTVNGHWRWCAAHPDTQCQAGPTGDAACTAANNNVADTCTRFFDGGGPGGYPCRDASGVTTDQQPAPIYIWANQCFNSGGTSIACPAAAANNVLMCTRAAQTGGQPLAGRDFIESATDAGAKPGYTPYVYPHPLNVTVAPPAVIGPGAATPVCVADSTGGSSHTLPLTINAGDTVVVGVTAYDGYIGSPFTVTDSGGATYSNPVKTQVSSGAGLAGSYIFVSPTPMTQAASSVIATRSSGSSKFVVCARTYTGVGGIGSPPTNNSGTNGGNLLTNINSLPTGHYIVSVFTASAATATTFSTGSPAAGTFLANASTTTPNTASAMLCENPAAANGVAACNASIPTGITWSASGIELVPGTAPPPQPPTILTFSASPSSIVVGGSSTLSWTTSNATSASINQGVGPVSANGSFNASPTATTTYTLTATNANGSSTANATVTVTTVATAVGLIRGAGLIRGGGKLSQSTVVTAITQPPKQPPIHHHPPQHDEFRDRLERECIKSCRQELKGLRQQKCVDKCRQERREEWHEK